MSLDFSKEKQKVERTIDSYTRKGQSIPSKVLSYYSDLQISSSEAPDLVKGNLSTGIFPIVTSVNSIVLVANTSREYILIQNIGEEIIYLNFNQPAGVLAGLQLIPGASWSSQFSQFATSEIHGIAETNTTTLAVYSIG